MKRRNNVVPVAIILAGLGSLAQAAELGYGYLQIDYRQTELELDMDGDTLTMDGTGFGFEFTKEIRKDTHVVVGYRSDTVDHAESIVIPDYVFSGDELSMSSRIEVEKQDIVVGIGRHWAVGENADFVARGQLVHGKLGASISYNDTYTYPDGTRETFSDSASDSDSDTSFGFTAGLRSMLSPKFELDGTLGYYSLDVWKDYDLRSTVISAGASYHFSDKFSLRFSYTDQGDASYTGLSFRFL